MPGYQFGGGSGLKGAALTSPNIPKTITGPDLANSLLSDDATNVSLASGKFIVPSASSPGLAGSANNNTGFFFNAAAIGALIAGSINWTSDASKLYLSVGFKPVHQAKTGNYTVTANDTFILADATSGAITLTLPAASAGINGTMGQIFVFSKTDSSANTVTVQRAGADTINGVTSKVLATQFSSFLVFGSSSTTWVCVTLTAA